MLYNKNQRKRRRKEWLFKRNPFCPICNVKMILPEKQTGRYGSRENAATMEHLNNKYHPDERYRVDTKEEQKNNFKTRKGRTILLCRKCNERIANDETKELPKKELWRRAGKRKRPVINWIKKFLKKHNIISDKW